MDTKQLIAALDSAVKAVRADLVAPAAPKDAMPNARWTHHGSGSFEWWSFKGYEVRKDSADQWVLRKAGEELYRHTYLQVIMAHAERAILAAAPDCTVAADAAAPSVIAAAEALIAADRAQALTTEHVNALENAIAIQRGELKVPAAQPDERAALKRAMDLLDTKLGDTDPNIEGMTQDEIDTTYPVLSTMQILSELYCATEHRATQRAMCTRVEISANSSHG